MTVDWPSLLPVLVGGGLAILGGMAGTIISLTLQAKNAGRIRKRELTATRQVDAERDAYGKLKQVEGLVRCGQAVDAARFIHEQQEWFFGQARLYLPDRVADYWLELRKLTAALAEETLKDPVENDVCRELHNSCMDTASRAIKEIYGETGHRRLSAK